MSRFKSRRYKTQLQNILYDFLTKGFSKIITEIIQSIDRAQYDFLINI